MDRVLSVYVVLSGICNLVTLYLLMYHMTVEHKKEVSIINKNVMTPSAKYPPPKPSLKIRKMCECLKPFCQYRNNPDFNCKGETNE